MLSFSIPRVACRGLVWGPFAVLLFIALAVPPVAEASVNNNYSVVANGVGSQYSGSDWGEEGGSAWSEQLVAYGYPYSSPPSGVADLPHITANFAADKKLVMELSAHDGWTFKVSPPSWSSLQLYIGIMSNQTTWSPIYPGTITSLEWVGLTGAAPVLQGQSSNVYYSKYSDWAQSFGWNIDATFTGPFSFTKLIVTLQVPDALAQNLPQVTDQPMYGSIGFYANDYSSYHPDPGQWVQIVPEPATVIVWSLLGGLAISIARWRRQEAA
jgi:hypothetical protein